MLTRNSPFNSTCLKKQKKEIGKQSTIIKASTKVKLLDRIDPKTNTQEIEVDIVVGLFKDTTIPRDTAEKQEAHTLKQEQQAYTTTILEQIVKKYWLYTGQNTEVMGFDLNVNNVSPIAQDPTKDVIIPSVSRYSSAPLRATTIAPGQQAFNWMYSVYPLNV